MLQCCKNANVNTQMCPSTFGLTPLLPTKHYHTSEHVHSNEEHLWKEADFYSHAQVIKEQGVLGTATIRCLHSVRKFTVHWGL